MNTPNLQLCPDTASPVIAKSGPEAEDRVVALIHHLIQTHRVAPGDRLVERELAQGAQANRQAIRAALARSERAGLVSIARNRGATVMQYSADSIRQVMHARIVNEGSALILLADRLDDAGSEALQAILRTEAAAYDDGRIAEARQSSRAFHLTFMELAGNVMMARFVGELIDCQPLLGAREPDRKTSFSGVAAHTKTLAALMRGEGHEAEAINTALLRALAEEFVQEAGRATPAD